MRLTRLCSFNNDFQQQPGGLRRLDEMSRIRGAEGLRGVMDLGLAPADAAARLRDQQSGVPQASGAAGSRDLKAEILERLANSNQKFPPT